MKNEDLCVAVDKLLKMKKIEDILPGCFTRRNIEGFKKTLNQKKRYESAKAQLGKGRAMFEKVIQQLVELPGWSHLGLICFTEIENRQVLKKYLPELTEEELKVILKVSKDLYLHIYTVISQKYSS